MSTATQQVAATLDDLYRVEGKAELIAGRIIHLMATGYKPSRVASRIFRSLDDYAEATGRGEAYTDNMGFAVGVLSSGRESFSPNASYFLGPFPLNEMRFLEGAPPSPLRSERERLRRCGRGGDGCQAGRLLRGGHHRRLGRRPRQRTNPEVSKAFPDHPIVFARGQEADAEPAVPGWRMAVDRIFA